MDSPLLHRGSYNDTSMSKHHKMSRL